MELVSFLRGDEFTANTFAAKKQTLADAPYFLDVRETEDLYLLMITNDTPRSDVLDHCVGIILTKETDDIVSYSFSRTSEILVTTTTTDNAVSDIMEHASLLEEDIARSTVTPYIEGVKMALYFYAGTWHFATTRMINAGNAYWGSSISFQEQVLEAMQTSYPRLHAAIIEPQLTGLLETNLTYTFLLASPAAQTVPSSCQTKLFHLGTFDTKTYEHVNRSIEVPSLPSTQMKSTADLVGGMLRSNCFRNNDVVNVEGFVSHGFIIQGKERYKMLNRDYMYVKDLRGNRPDISRHYLDIRHNATWVQELMRYYPDTVKMAQSVERRIFSVSERLLKLYVEYHIVKKTRPMLDKTVFVTMQQIHSAYQGTGIKRNIYNIHQHVSNLPPAILSHLLRVERWQLN